MNEYINLTLENIEKEHICCAIGDPKHQVGVNNKKEWIKSKLKDGHVFRKLNARGKIFIEYEPIETAWIPISGKNYEYIYCLWVAGRYKGKGIAKELLEYAINDSKEKGMSGICTLASKKKKPFVGEKQFFLHYGFKVVDEIGDYEYSTMAPTDSWGRQAKWLTEKGKKDMLSDMAAVKQGLYEFTKEYTTKKYPGTIQEIEILGADEKEFECGETLQLSMRVEPSTAAQSEVSWSSSNPSVASVDGKGLVTMKSAGKQ